MLYREYIQGILAGSGVFASLAVVVMGQIRQSVSPKRAHNFAVVLICSIVAAIFAIFFGLNWLGSVSPRGFVGAIVILSFGLQAILFCWVVVIFWLTVDAPAHEAKPDDGASLGADRPKQIDTKLDMLTEEGKCQQQLISGIFSWARVLGSAVVLIVIGGPIPLVSGFLWGLLVGLFELAKCIRACVSDLVKHEKS